MSIGPLAAAPVAIQIHATAALFAVIIGLVVLFRRKGDVLHRFLGRVWVTLMFVLAGSAFFVGDITQVGPLSILYVLAAYVLFALSRGVWFILHGDVRRHRRTMRALFFYALLTAGTFTLLPGRVMNDAVTGGAGGWWPLAVAGAISVGLAVFYFANRRAIDRFDADRIGRGVAGAPAPRVSG